MIELAYHLESEIGKSKSYFVCRLEPASYWTAEKLKAVKKSSLEEQGLNALLRYTLREKPIALGAFIDRLLYPLDDSFEILKLLATSGRLVAFGKKVVVDPFVQLSCVAKVIYQTPDQAEVIFSCCQESEWVVAADPSWVMQGGIIRALKERISPRWLRQKQWQGKELFSLLEEIKECMRVEEKHPQGLPIEDPLPFLILTDRYGAFANLYFDYGPRGIVAAHNPQEGAGWRDRACELGWERDLLETGFIKKMVDTSHYYCSLDQVTKTVTFLLEMGWKIQDAKGRWVQRQTAVHMDGAVVDKGVLLQGKMHYGDHSVDLQNVVGAFNRQERFMELSADSVALIDYSTLSGLAGEEVLGEGILVKPYHVETLQHLFSSQESLRETLAPLITQTPTLPSLPGASFQGNLFPYQQQGLEWLQFLQQRGWGGVLADEMGLGKTVQLIAFLSTISFQAPVLIVVPTSLVFNWEKEFRQFLPSVTVQRYEGGGVLPNSSVILVSYARLRLEAELFQSIHYQLVVLDEAQAIKNPQSQISLVCKELKGSMRLAITGTPIENRWEELWSLFQFVQPQVLGSKSEMQRGLSNPLYVAKMGKRLSPFMRRRTKAEVALDLPEKLEQTVFVEMAPAERSLYDEVVKKTRQGVLKKVESDGAASHRMEILEAILRLRQCCAHPSLIAPTSIEGSKLERVMADLQEVVSEGRKVLVYSQFTQMLRHIESQVQEKGWKYVYLDGSTDNREEVVTQFQNNLEISIFLISLKAGGVGLNLTAADYVFLYDPWWNVAVENQAIDRAHRLGRRSAVIARRYIMAMSIEEKMMTLKQHKHNLSRALFEALPEGSCETASIDELVELLTDNTNR